MKKYLVVVLAVILVIGTGVWALQRSNSQEDPNAVAGPSSLTVKELGFKFQLPDDLRDLKYKMGNGPETHIAADFSNTRLSDVGGEPCTAGNHVGVSAYPLGQVVVADETPEHVAEEVKENPEEGLGDFIIKIGEKYLYYNEAPPEPCFDDPQVKQLQKDGAAALRAALKTAEPTNEK